MARSIQEPDGSGDNPRSGDLAGDPSRSGTAFEIKCLDWQTNVSASIDVKRVSAELANQIEGRTLGAAGQALLDVINAGSDVQHLDEAAKLLWKRYGESAIGDGEAEYLSNAIYRRRPLGHHVAPGHATQVGRVNGRVVSRFLSRQRQRSPDRKASRDRRRTLGGSSALPDNLRHHYTEGQRAVLCIVAFEVKRHKVCDLPVEKIAALAGVGRTTVQTTMHEARRLGHLTIVERPRRGCKSLTNLVHVSSQEWNAWLSRGPSAPRLIGSKSVKMASTTKIKDLRKEGASNPQGNPPRHPLVSAGWISTASVQNNHMARKIVLES